MAKYDKQEDEDRQRRATIAAKLAAEERHRAKLEKAKLAHALMSKAQAQAAEHLKVFVVLPHCCSTVAHVCVQMHSGARGTGSVGDGVGEGPVFMFIFWFLHFLRLVSHWALESAAHVSRHHMYMCHIIICICITSSYAAQVCEQQCVKAGVNAGTVVVDA